MIRNLYEEHRGQFMVTEISDGEPEVLGKIERETVKSVLEFYGDDASIWLRDLSHMENPWKDARKEAGLARGERGRAIISEASMAEYYFSI